MGALQESLQEEELRHIRNAQIASTSTTTTSATNPLRSAASVRAGQAALLRAEADAERYSSRKKNSSNKNLQEQRRNKKLSHRPEMPKQSPGGGGTFTTT